MAGPIVFFILMHLWCLELGTLNFFLDQKINFLYKNRFLGGQEGRGGEEGGEGSPHSYPRWRGLLVISGSRVHLGLPPWGGAVF